ncbi:MAG: hypothetical protein LBK23_00255, partial [Oscillospiraceae bacterium]|nr:hypothetical protein [Oscillospiraceae bacterium]
MPCPYYSKTSKSIQIKQDVVNCQHKAKRKAGYQMESNAIMLSEEQREELEKFSKSGIHSAMQ